MDGDKKYKDLLVGAGIIIDTTLFDNELAELQSKVEDYVNSYSAEAGIEKLIQKVKNP